MPGARLRAWWAGGDDAGHAAWLEQLARRRELGGQGGIAPAGSCEGRVRARRGVPRIRPAAQDGVPHEPQQPLQPRLDDLQARCELEGLADLVRRRSGQDHSVPRRDVEDERGVAFTTPREPQLAASLRRGQRDGPLAEQLDDDVEPVQAVLQRSLARDRGAVRTGTHRATSFTPRGRERPAFATARSILSSAPMPRALAPSPPGAFAQPLAGVAVRSGSGAVRLGDFAAPLGACALPVVEAAQPPAARGRTLSPGAAHRAAGARLQRVAAPAAEPLRSARVPELLGRASPDPRRDPASLVRAGARPARCAS